MTDFVSIGGNPNLAPTDWEFETAEAVEREWTINHAANGATGVPASTTIRGDLHLSDQTISLLRFALSVWRGPPGGPFIEEVVRLRNNAVFEAGWTGNILLVDAYHAQVTIDRDTDFAAGELVNPAFKYFVE